MRLNTINITQYGTAICLTITHSWDVTPCGWVYGYKHFRVPTFLLFILVQGFQQYLPILWIPSTWRQWSPAKFWNIWIFSNTGENPQLWKVYSAQCNKREHGHCWEWFGSCTGLHQYGESWTWL